MTFDVQKYLPHPPTLSERREARDNAWWAYQGTLDLRLQLVGGDPDNMVAAESEVVAARDRFVEAYQDWFDQLVQEDGEFLHWLNSRDEDTWA